MDPARFSRTFDVLDLLVARPDGLRLTEVSQALGTPVSSTHNLLQTMVAAEVAAVTEDLRYTIGARSVRLGIRIIDSLEVRGAARRHLERLAQAIGYDVYLAVGVGHRVVYVDRLVGTQPVTVNIRLGTALALHATAVGKLFAANVPVLRRRALSRAAAVDGSHHHRRSGARTRVREDPGQRLRDQSRGGLRRDRRHRGSRSRRIRAARRSDPRVHAQRRARGAAAQPGHQGSDLGGPAHRARSRRAARRRRQAVAVEGRAAGTGSVTAGSSSSRRTQTQRRPHRRTGPGPCVEGWDRAPSPRSRCRTSPRRRIPRRPPSRRSASTSRCRGDRCRPRTRSGCRARPRAWRTRRTDFRWAR